MSERIARLERIVKPREDYRLMAFRTEDDRVVLNCATEGLDHGIRVVIDQADVRLLRDWLNANMPA